MKTKEKTDLHKKICDKISETYEKKNHDYGDTFSVLFQKYGMIYPIIHLKEKLARIEQLSKEAEKVEGESIKDSLLDLANYAILALLEIQTSQETEVRE